MNELTETPANEDRDRAADPGFDPHFAGPETGSPNGGEKKFIVFTLGDTDLAIESRSVSEVGRDLTATALPNLPEWILGIANLRSEITTVIDLERLLGSRSEKTVHQPKHIVLRSDKPDALIAFKVDKLCEMVTFAARDVEPFRDETVDFLSARIRHRSQSLVVLNAAKLFTALTLT